MERINDILKSAQWHQSLQNSLKLSSKELVRLSAHESITKSLSGINMIAEIAQSMQLKKMTENPTISAVQAVTKSMSFQSKFTIPQTTIDAITSINRQHEQLFSGIRAMSEALKIQSSALAQVNNLNFAFNNISRQIAAIAVQQRNWTIIDDFEEVSGQAIEFSEGLTHEVTEEQKRQFQTLLTLVSTFVKKYGVQGLLIFDIILRFAGIHQYYDFLKEKPVLATKQEINQISIKQESVIHFISVVNEQLREVKEYRKTRRVCEVKLKPKSKTLILSKLPKDFEVIVIQVHHKWVYVSYFDPKDNLPQSGWIMKKYLDRPN